MDILGFINNSIDSAKNAIKEIVTPQNAAKTEKTTNITFVSKDTLAKQKNEDTINIKNNTITIDKIYKQIEALCVDYRMDFQDVKKSKLIENIAGCTTEELLKKSDNEIQEYIDSLKFVLKWQSWKMPWQDRGTNDIKAIAAKANERYTYLKTGGSFISNTFRFKKSLGERLERAGYKETNSHNVKSYFKNIIEEAVLSGNKERIEKAYNKARETFGYLLIDTKNPEEKAFLTAAISELDASFRNTAAKLSISSCQNNRISQQKVARGLSDNFEDYTKADALGNRTTEEQNIEISQISFEHMTEADSMEVLSNMAERRRELEQKIQNGEKLSEDEAHYYNTAQKSQYSGALIGASCNTNSNNKNEIISKINSDTEKFGIQKEVYTKTSNYIESHKETLPKDTKTLNGFIEKANNNSFSKELNEVQNKSSINKETTKNTTIQEADKVDNKTFAKTKISDVKIANTQKAEATNITKSSNNTISKQEKEAPITKEKVFISDVKTAKQYAKDNNIKTFDLAIESLNSTNLDRSIQKWALDEFKKADDSLQILKFKKISNIGNAIAAAKVMNEQTREQINTYRSYAIKQSLENIEQEASA